MNNRFFGRMLNSTIVAAIALVGLPAQAALIFGPDIIAAPAFVTNASVTNIHQQGFNEQQGVTLGAALAVDAGFISARTVVDSHMIFFNISSTVSSGADIETWVFDGVILGVMSDTGGTLEAASTPILGALGTTYQAPLTNRGLEAGTADSYTVAGNTIIVNMNVAQPGDWIRVVTATDVPEPGSVALLGLGLAGLGFSRRRKQQTA